MSELLSVLLFAVAGAAAVAAEYRPLRSAAVAYWVHGGLLTLALLAAQPPWTAVLAALVGRALVLPYLVWRYAGRAGEAEATALPDWLSVAGAVLLGACAFGGAYLLAPDLVPGDGAALLLAGGTAVVAVGSWAVGAHRDSFKAVLGFCLVENGVTLALAALAPHLPEMAELGVLLDAVLAVWLLLLTAGRAADAAGGSRNPGLLNRLKG